LAELEALLQRLAARADAAWAAAPLSGQHSMVLWRAAPACTQCLLAFMLQHDVVGVCTRADQLHLLLACETSLHKLFDLRDGILYQLIGGERQIIVHMAHAWRDS